MGVLEMAVDEDAVIERYGGRVNGAHSTEPPMFDRNGHEIGADESRASSARVLKHVFGADINVLEEYDDELIEGVLGRNCLAVLYGESNSGKTFLAVDIAAAVAEGARWHGRNVVGGVVLYLACEAPESVRMRFKARKVHSGHGLQRLVIVSSPVNFFEGDADVHSVIALVQRVESELGEKVALIVGDTLARLSAGANENAGSDMGQVLRRADELRHAVGAAFLLIHHSGKDQTKGMRGWSGLRAAVDTEIEVTVDATIGVHTAEVMKQRDLPGKGTRIGFRLQVEFLGTNRWGAHRTSCVVLPADAPAKPEKDKPLGETAGAILEFLKSRGTGCKRSVIAAHFKDRYDRGNVYKQIAGLIKRGRLSKTGDFVAIAGRPGPAA